MKMDDLEVPMEKEIPQMAVSGTCHWRESHNLYGHKYLSWYLHFRILKFPGLGSPHHISVAKKKKNIKKKHVELKAPKKYLKMMFDIYLPLLYRDK